MDEILEQKYLNVTTRAQSYMEIMMYVPDNNVQIANISSNDILDYSNINTLKDIKNYTSTTIATLEENMWLLNGRFINPTPGTRYKGYISNSVSDEDGQFGTNPKINIELYSISNIEYFSIILNPSVPSGYPEQVKVSFLDSSNNIISFITKTISEETQLPNLIYEANVENVSKLEIEFINTVTPYRRIRVAALMFGKVINLTEQDLIRTDYLDKCSYVADSIPSRTFTFDLANYDKVYNIDNPNNEYVDLDRQTRVLIRNGYNIAGYTEDEDGNGSIVNPYREEIIAWDDWKELRLLNIYTNSEDEVSFECGSILDMMEDVYTGGTFVPNEPVYLISNKLLDFMNLDTSTVIFSTDNNSVSYGDYTINIPLPELPVRELFQLLAFSVGATLLIKDDGTIKFANLDISETARQQEYPSFTNHHSFTYNDFENVPAAEQLENTDKISLPKYNSTISPDTTTIATVDVQTTYAEISYPACTSVTAIVAPDDTSGGSVQDAVLYTSKGYLTTNIPTANTSVKVEIKGQAITTTQTQDRNTTPKDTLIIDTQLMSYDPNSIIKSKYLQWYGKKFKYSITTRGEPLVDAGDYCKIQSPFSGTEQLLDTFVLQNHITFDGAWDGDMEVIVI